MKSKFILFFFLSFSVLSYSQESDNMNSAIEFFVSSMPAPMKDEMKRKLLDTGKSEAQVEKIVTEAVHKYASCAVSAAVDQAKAQGISDDVILKSFARQSMSEAQAQEARTFDSESFRNRLGGCRSELSENVGLEIQ